MSEEHTHTTQTRSLVMEQNFFVKTNKKTLAEPKQTQNLQVRRYKQNM